MKIIKFTVQPYPMEAMGGWTMIRPETPRKRTIIELLAGFVIVLLMLDEFSIESNSLTVETKKG